MMADPGTFGVRVNPCGCRGVPEGIHLPDCSEYEATSKAIAETNVLEDANHAIERNHSSYGHPLDDARRFATIARAATGLPIEAAHFPRIMLAVKLARLAASPFHRDSLTDVAGYARAAEMMANKAQEDIPPLDTAESVQADAEQPSHLFTCPNGHKWRAHRAITCPTCRTDVRHLDPYPNIKLPPADAEQEPPPGVAGDDPPYGSLTETPEGFEYGPRTWEESE